ncbi:MAG: histidine kinase, partial [Legionellales bacterium RIFCSPHIGHO2_12_FULL_42_9]
MKKSLGIKYHLRMTTLIPVLVVAILFGVFYNCQFGNDLNQHITRLGESYIKQLLPAAQLAMMRRDWRTLQGLIDASTINSEVKALAFYNAAGDLIAYRGGKHAINKPFQPLQFTGDYVESQKMGANLINFVTPVTLPKYNLYSSASLMTPKDFSNSPADDILGWLSIDLDTKSMQIKRYQMLIVTLIITLLGLLIGSSIHFFFSKPIYLPISRLRRSMKQILNNEFETKISTTSRGELGVIEQGCAHLQNHYLSHVRDLNQHIELATADLQQGIELLEEKNIQLSLEKKKTEEKSRQKSEFIANMSHEIRTPMNSIIGFSNVLLKSNLDPLQIDYVKTVKSSAKDLLMILNDILDYSKIDSGKLHLDSIPLDLRACIDEVLTLAAPNAHKKNLDLIPVTSIEVPKMLLGDPIRIKQILTNLVNNAIKFTDNGHVLVTTTILEECSKNYTVAIAVSDTGIGIPLEDQNKLFNAFTQADLSITRRFGGTGLGLVICKKLSEAMQGRITLTSEPYQGSVFTAFIQLEKFNSYEMEKHQSTRLSHLKALCFDANPLYLQSISNGLGCLGVSCVVHNSPARFHQETLTDQQQYDFALIGINGNIDESIRDFLNHKTIPTIFVSKGLPQDPTLFGTDAFLFKPLSIQKLQETIESLCTHSSTLKNSTKPELSDLRDELKSKHLHILIAEDNLLNQMLLKSLLNDSAHIHLVEDGLQAVHACRKKRYDIILLDLQMPNLNGFQATEKIRSECLYNQTTPIVAITANSTDMQSEQSCPIGIDLCLHKPINEYQLLTELLLLSKQGDTSAINWQLGVEKVAGDLIFAKKYLADFVAELHKNRGE